MAERIVYDVIPRDSPGNTRWAVKRRGAERASDVFDDKVDAVARAVELAKAVGHSQVVLHGRDGKIQTEYTYGNDPYPPKG
jgi:hypothetical protein